MKNDVFIYYGAIYIFFHLISGFLIISTYVLLFIYLIMALNALRLVLKYKSRNQLVLLGVTLFVPLYIWITWTDKTIIYIPDFVHSLAGIILIVYAVVFSKK